MAPSVFHLPGLYPARGGAAREKRTASGLLTFRFVFVAALVCHHKGQELG
jgi:hypothetical protein